MTAQSSTDREAPARYPRLDWLVTLSPVIAIALLQVMYLVAPDFYLKYVLEEQTRERGIVEIVTFACALPASLMLIRAAWKCRQAGGRLLGAVLIATVALAAFFFAGEEISWGQTYLGWETPPEVKDVTGHNETNVHNMELEIPLPFSIGGEKAWRPSVQSLGSMFIIFVFIVLPLLWMRTRHPRLPRSIGCAIPEWPVAFCCVAAFVWKGYKDIYKSMVDDHESRAYYMQFVEQINEHKEMVVALTLFWYGVYRTLNCRAIRLKDSS